MIQSQLGQDSFYVQGGLSPNTMGILGRMMMDGTKT